MSDLLTRISKAELWFEQNYEDRDTELFDKCLRAYAKLLEREAELIKLVKNKTI